MDQISAVFAAHDAATWALVAFATAAGGALRGLTGFGSALLMAPLLSMVLPARETLCLVTLLNALPMGRAATAAASRLVDREVMLPMTLAAFAGVPCGIALVHVLPARLFGMVIGGAVMLSACALMAGRSLPGGRSRPLSLGVGALSGVLTGLGGVGGPPAILYLLGVEADNHRARANFIVFFAWLYPVALAAILALGMLSWAEALAWLALAPLFLLGGMAGGRLYALIGRAHFRPFVLALLLLAGAMAAWPKAAEAAPKWAGDALPQCGISCNALHEIS